MEDYKFTHPTDQKVEIMQLGSGVKVMLPVPEHLIPPMDAYIIGDELGRMYEGGGPFNPKRMIDHFETIRRTGYMHTVNTGGTDESDMARAMVSFRDFTSGMRYEYIPTEWIKHLFRAKRSTRYGNSMKKAFAITRMMKNVSGHEKLQNALLRNDSFGNGCLSIVYPFFLLCREPRYTDDVALFKNVLVDIVKLTHNSDQAVAACTFLFDAFIRRDMRRHRLPPWWLEHPDTTATGCLARAYKIALEPRVDDLYDIMEYTATCGGDVDSYLSLAFLIHQFVRLHDKVKTHGLPSVARNPATGSTFLRDFSISAVLLNS